MPIHELKEQIARLPEQPGVYLWLNRAGDTLYVGKARVLRDRVRSYLGAYGTSPRHDALLDEIAGIEVIVTDSVVEALALENNLIKQRTPKFNILLRDDKSFPYILITGDSEWPQITKHRGARKRKGKYFGPFASAGAVNATINALQRAFPLRNCSDQVFRSRTRP